MTAAHDPDHEAWLAERLAADRPPADWPEPYASCRECRGAFERLRATARRLARAAEEERRLLEQVLGPAGTAGGGEPVRAPRDREVAGRPRRAHPLRLAAAAALLAAAAWLVVPALQGLFAGRRGAPAGAPNGVRLAPAFDLEASRGSGGAWTFAWRYPLPPAGSFTVRVRGADGRVIVESEGLTEPRWTPEGRLRERIPERFVWEVLVFDATGELVARARAAYPPGEARGRDG